MALGHLEGLARGLGGFGVLRTSKERLEKAAQAAEDLGHHELARQMQEIANEMPSVRDASAAMALATRLKSLVNDTWVLGRTCKGVIVYDPTRREEIRAILKRSTRS